MKRRFQFFAILVLLARTAVAGDKLQDDVSSTVKRQFAVIRRELSTLTNHPWAGDYEYETLGDSVTVAVAPIAGFAFTRHGCLGLYDQNYGAVRGSNGSLHLSFTYPNRAKGLEGLSTNFFIVDWGQRKYLVATNDLVAFCNSVNSGLEAFAGSGGPYLLRAGDENKKVIGLPAVPSKFRGYLLDQPIEAVITAVRRVSTRPSISDWKFKDVAVTMNVGRRHGVLPGMQLHVISPKNKLDTVEVTAVREGTSSGVVTYFDEDHPIVKVGWKFSTRMDL